ncbi:MAG: glucosamine-6-phosphate isomerase [Spirochaetes bacterium GWC2_52_13]|nr:MAG: glucosamine-6-phosphate isomerase [Spirochaetes bacterium GWC2_52_13]HCG64006.1 glucosamine-6-phosphate isomerase [Sphaerochaeta sp.]
MRNSSKVAKQWWDYTTLDTDLLDAAARLEARDLLALQRPGFSVELYDTRESFFLAEALEYINAFTSSTADNPTGLCGPIGPTEQLPLVAQIINDQQLDVRNAHFWGMDEWVVDGKEVNESHPLSFKRADMELLFNRIDKHLRMPDHHLHFPTVAGLADYTASFDQVTCLCLQGGQGETKHWAFNDPPQRVAPYLDNPPSPAEYRKLSARMLEIHPMTMIQNARTSGGGVVSNIPSHAVTVGPVETWKSEKVSIWHPGWHDNPFGMRLTAYMLGNNIVDTSVPMSLLAEHPNVVFHYLVPNLGTCMVEMH